MPDYQLDFQEVHVAAIIGDTVTVDYTLSNTGSNKLVNVMAYIEVEAKDATGTSLGVLGTWTSAETLDAGALASGILYFAYGSNPVSTATAYVTQVAWDKDDGSGFTLF